jgi:hypothetical protein
VDLNCGSDGVDALAARWPRSVRFNAVELPAEAEVRRFSPSFPGIPPDKTAKLATAAALFATMNLEIDSVLDADRKPRLGALDLVAIQFEGYRILAELFPGESPLWEVLRQSLIRYADVIRVQREFDTGTRRLTELTYDVAVEVAKAKTALAPVTVAALGELAGQTHIAGRLRDSIDHLMVAKCFYDDVLDWRQDAEAGRRSYVLAGAIQVADLGPWPSGGWSASQLDGIGRALYFHGVAQDALGHARGAVSSARSAAAGLSADDWISYIDELESLIRGCLAQLPQPSRLAGPSRSQPGLTVRLPDASGRPWRALALTSLRWMLRQWALGFPDANHFVTFSELRPEAPVQCGDVFTRAVIANVMAQADRDLAGGELSVCVSREVEHILARRRASEPGLWSYFPDLPELPCDADDLAEALRLLNRAGRAPKFKEELDRALRCAFEDGACADGGFDSWVIGRRQPDEGSLRQIRAARETRGEGADPEVVANLMHAVEEYQPGRWSQARDLGRTYLLASQSADGSWPSGWYHGLLYGTYQCLRALTTLPGDASAAAEVAVARATEYVLSRQLPDGGWANTGEASDPLGTALALLALGHTAADTDRCRPAALRALDWLRAAEREGAAYRPVPLILMHPRRASGLREPLSFGSVSVTAALICQASMLWDQRW